MKRTIVLLGIIALSMSCKKKHCVTCTEDSTNGGRVQFYQECGVRGNAKGGEIANRELEGRDTFHNPECTVLPE